MSWRKILAEASEVDDRNGVTYYEVETKRVLNPVNVPHLPFELSLNPYLNCEVGCSYCYARDFSSKRQGGLGSFDREIYAKRDAPRLLRKELVRLESRGGLGKPIAVGTATDPYQPLEKRARLTRRLLEVMADFGGISVSITTKSDLVLRDLDVLASLSANGYVRVNMTLTTPDRDLARSMEPRAPTPKKRLAAVEALSRAGIPVGVFCMPIIPDVNDSPRDLRYLVCESKAAGAVYFCSRVLELRSGVKPAFFAWLREARPALVQRTLRRYARRSNPPEEISLRIKRQVEVLCQQYGLPAMLAFPKPRPRAPDQLELFSEPAKPSADPRPLPIARLQGAA